MRYYCSKCTFKNSRKQHYILTILFQNRMFFADRVPTISTKLKSEHTTNKSSGNLCFVRYWRIDECCKMCVCLCVSHLCTADNTSNWFGLSRHANVFNPGNGSQSWFHKNNDDGRNVNGCIYSNWSGKRCLHCVFCDANSLNVGLPKNLGRGDSHTYLHVIISPQLYLFSGNPWILEASCKTI